ncbi:Octanoyltransferase [Candidatus Profftia lariciata]|uniref:lipoyl(octanoyl) transferase LipB n=1 Tax=Candidatus Profftia lariciata TaxID=1987921 RepID=UPI001D019AC3|nr:lipoyl(octanoyl) transferase LipB [Candidatus Profftia lariciata]UDG81272.1 Octanoyltransferase [Candidatus Profftia lariciata]
MQQKKVLIRQLGLQEYMPIVKAMYTFTNQRTKNTFDELWLLEHYPIFTQGKTGNNKHILTLGDIPVIQSDRGGQITYHAPGQQIMYVLIDLKRNKYSARQLVNNIEQAVIDTLAYFGIVAHSIVYAPGVYVNEQKICSLGLRIYKGCSFHGLALNTAMDLSPFNQINPCGFTDIKMTQISILNINVTLKDVQVILVEKFTQILGYNTVEFYDWKICDYK